LAISLQRALFPRSLLAWVQSNRLI